MVNKLDDFSWNEEIFGDFLADDFAISCKELNLTVLQEGLTKSSKNIMFKIQRKV